jgi:hypothetical protein
MYYFADDTKACFPGIFTGTGRCGIYDIIIIEDLKTPEYIHADFQNDSWVVHLERTIYTNLFFSKKWVEDFVKKNNITVCGIFIKHDEIVLRDDEKITDENGISSEIHIVRDEKNKLIYFNMNDIINCNSEMRNYYNTITYYLTCKRRQYIYRRHTHNKPVVLSIYFTYYGILAFTTKGNFPFLKRLDEWIRKINFTKNTDLRYQPPSEVVEKTEIETEEETVEEEHVDNIIQKTIIENNETEDNSVFKCIIDWFEFTFTSFCR